MRRWSVLLTVLALSCKRDLTDVDASAEEGDDANECRDGADNDQDAFFDCDDQGCWGSPDCDEADADTDADADGDTDADADSDTSVDAGVAGHLESMTLTMDFAIDFAAIMEGVDTNGDGDPDYVDCVSHYVGDGTYVDSADLYVTMQGAWKLASSDCNPDFQSPDIVWYNDATLEAYHSFHFDENLTYLDKWVAHRIAGDVEPTQNPAGRQFYIYDMFADYDDDVRVIDYTETYTSGDLLGSQFITTYHVEFNAP